MYPGPWSKSLLLAWAFTTSLAAHPIPTLVVEAEFHPDHTCEIRVNMDPRLFLHEVPSTLPPVPGSWWLDQDDVARAQTSEKARAHLDRTLHFTWNDAPMRPGWEVIAIDSTLATELTPTSAEVHLLARSRVPLHPLQGELKARLEKSSAVPLILLTTGPGSKQVPQSVYPGESSRGFSPAITVPPAVAISEPPHPSPPSGHPGWRIAAGAILLLTLLGWTGYQWRQTRAKSP